MPASRQAFQVLEEKTINKHMKAMQEQKDPLQNEPQNQTPIDKEQKIPSQEAPRIFRGKELDDEKKMISYLRYD